LINLNIGGNNSKIVWMVGVGAVVAAIVSWLLPKIEKPPVVVHKNVTLPVIPTATTVATGPAAVEQSMGPVRDYNLSGLAIEDHFEGYPSRSGVSMSIR
jgi:hypothetical protein